MTAPACWNCGQAPEDFHFCRHCDHLQPPSGNYFQYLGLPPKLLLDPAEIERHFYEWSRRLHPDRFAQRPERERLIAELASARLNDAYRTLRDRLRRAEYVLGLHKIQKKGHKGATPPELLEEAFELRTAQDAQGGDSRARVRWQALLSETDAALEASFADWDRDGSRTTLESIAALLARRSYIANALQSLTP